MIKRKGGNKKYVKERNEYLQENPVCQTQIFGENDPEAYQKLLSICEKKAVTIQHMDGRDKDKLTEWENCIGLCAMCHQFVDVHTTVGKQLGYLKE